MKSLVLAMLIVSCLCKDFYDIDKSETVEIPANGSAKFRISINIGAGLTYIPTNFGNKLEFKNLIGTLVPGNNDSDFQYFEVFCTPGCVVGEEISFSLFQTQASHLGGHILHPVHAKVIEANQN